MLKSLAVGAFKGKSFTHSHMVHCLDYRESCPASQNPTVSDTAAGKHYTVEN